MKTKFLEKTKTGDFRLYLQQELLRRCERNKSYSLRAFAQSLGMDHSTLSKVLSGKRKLTEKGIRTLGAKASLSPREIQSYIASLKQTEISSRSQKARQNLNQYNVLINDTFTAISEWYHDAILELTHIEGFESDPQWIAKVLGITVTEVKIAVERLVRLDLLQISLDGDWRDVSRSNTNILDHDFTSAAMKKYQKKVLEMSTEALEAVPRTLRDHTSMMVAIDTNDILTIKEKIKDFRYELTAYLEREGVRPNSIYQLGVSFFPLTKKITKRNN